MCKNSQVTQMLLINEVDVIMADICNNTRQDAKGENVEKNKEKENKYESIWQKGLKTQQPLIGISCGHIVSEQCH